MEKIIFANDVRDSLDAGCRNGRFSLSAIVMKGHSECGDSAFFYCDDEKAFGGVFDGVSGERNAGSASSDAAQMVLAFLKTAKTADEKSLEQILFSVNKKIIRGFTTASIFFLGKNGNYAIASVGDSSIFTISKGKALLECVADRPVGVGSPVSDFLRSRNIVASVLGMKEIQIQTKSGKLKKDDMLLLCSDGVSDNLLIKVKNSFVVDDSGVQDLSGILKNENEPKKIVDRLSDDIKLRMDHPPMVKAGFVFEPKEDDISIVACRFL